MSSNNIHTQALNLARRLSIRAENDLLQETFVDDTPASGGITEEVCSSMLRQLKLDSIPQDCHRFESFRSAWTQHENSWDPRAFLGMNARETLEAQSAREHGRLNQAQILRRMSSRSKANERSWF